MELGIGLTAIVPPVVYFIGIIVIMLTLFYKVEIGLYFLIPILTQQSLLEHMRGYPMGADFIDLLFFALLVKWFIDRDKKEEKSKWRKTMNIILPLIFVWTFVGLWIGAFVLQTDSPLSMSDPRFVHWKNFIMLPILYLIVVNNVKNEQQIKILLLLMTVSMLYMDRSFYHNFANKNRSNFSYDLRVGSTFSYLGPNEVAVFYAQNTIIILCLWAFEGYKYLRWFFGVTTIFNYYCLMFQYSRGGYLAGIVTLFFYGIIKDRKVLLALVLVMVFWQMFLPTSVQQRISMSQTAEGTDTSITVRYDMWDQALELVSSSPIFGLGYDVTPWMGIKTDGKRRRSLHNGYLQLLVEQGAIGLLIFLTFFFTSFRLGWRLYKNAKSDLLKALGLGYAGCVLAVLAGNIFGSYWFYLNVSAYYWVNLGLVVKGLELTDATKSEETENAALDPQKDFAFATS